jgi:hypothetical protein
MIMAQDLSGKTPKELYGLAVRAGIETAVKRDKLAEWWINHPDFLALKAQVLEGSKQSFAEVMAKIAEIPGVVAVINENGDGTSTVWERVDPD